MSNVAKMEKLQLEQIELEIALMQAKLVKEYEEIERAKKRFSMELYMQSEYLKLAKEKHNHGGCNH